MRIIFLNCWFGKVGKDFDEFVKARAKSTDVFCLQEVQPELFSKLQSLLPDHKGKYMTENKILVVGYIYGQAVFTRNNIKTSSPEKIGLYRNVTNDAGFGQCFDLAVGKSVVHIANIHGKARPGHKLDTSARLKQSGTMISLFKNKTGPKIIGGDFNLVPNTESIRMFEKAGYRNLIKEFKIGSTRNRLGWEQFKDQPGFVKQYFADYVFVSPEVKVKNFEVPNIEISDHLPLILDFEI